MLSLEEDRTEVCVILRKHETKHVSLYKRGMLMMD